jgi:hypothetical protein
MPLDFITCSNFCVEIVFFSKFMTYKICDSLSLKTVNNVSTPGNLSIKVFKHGVHLSTEIIISSTWTTVTRREFSFNRGKQVCHTFSGQYTCR